MLFFDYQIIIFKNILYLENFCNRKNSFYLSYSLNTNNLALLFAFIFELNENFFHEKILMTTNEFLIADQTRIADKNKKIFKMYIMIDFYNNI